MQIFDKFLLWIGTILKNIPSNVPGKTSLSYPASWIDFNHFVMLESDQKDNFWINRLSKNFYILHWYRRSFVSINWFNNWFTLLCEWIRKIFYLSWPRIKQKKKTNTKEIFNFHIVVSSLNFFSPNRILSQFKRNRANSTKSLNYQSHLSINRS